MPVTKVKKRREPVDIGRTCDSGADHDLIDHALRQYEWRMLTFGGIPLRQLACFRSDGRFNPKSGKRWVEFAYDQEAKRLWMRYASTRSTRFAFRAFDKAGPKVTVTKPQRNPGFWDGRVRDHVYHVPVSLATSRLIFSPK
jgi:hypothetical protein